MVSSGHPKNALSGTTVMPAPSDATLSAKLNENAPSPSVVTASGSSAACRLGHPANAYFPTDCSDDGSRTAENAQP